MMWHTYELVGSPWALSSCLSHPPILSLQLVVLPAGRKQTQ